MGADPVGHVGDASPTKISMWGTPYSASPTNFRGGGTEIAKTIPKIGQKDLTISKFSRGRTPEPPATNFSHSFVLFLKWVAKFGERTPEEDIAKIMPKRAPGGPQN